MQFTVEINMFLNTEPQKVSYVLRSLDIVTVSDTTHIKWYSVSC